MDNELPVAGKLYKIIKKTSFHNEENTWHPCYDEGIVFLVKLNKLNSHRTEYHYILANGKLLYHTISGQVKEFWFHFAEIK